MIRIEKLTEENFNVTSLDGFIRYQEVTRVYRKTDGEYKVVFEPFYEDWSPERKREKATEILTGDYISFGAFDGDRVIGEIMVCGDLNKGRAVVSSLHVSQDYRRHGVGRALFNTAREYAKDRCARALYFSACSAYETIAFYYAMGCRMSPDPIEELALDEPYDLQLECEI